MKLFGLIGLISIAAVQAADAQPAMQNQTGYPNDIAAARLLGIVDAITQRCPNLEIAPDGEAMLLNMGRIGRQDVERSIRLRSAYDRGAATIQPQEFDPECASPLQSMKLFLRVKPDHSVPDGPGWTRQYVRPTPGP